MKQRGFIKQVKTLTRATDLIQVGPCKTKVGGGHIKSFYASAVKSSSRDKKDNGGKRKLYLFGIQNISISL